MDEHQNMTWNYVIIYNNHQTTTIKQQPSNDGSPLDEHQNMTWNYNIIYNNHQTTTIKQQPSNDGSPLDKHQGLPLYRLPDDSVTSYFPQGENKPIFMSGFSWLLWLYSLVNNIVVYLSLFIIYFSKDSSNYNFFFFFFFFIRLEGYTTNVMIIDIHFTFVSALWHIWDKY